MDLKREIADVVTRARAVPCSAVHAADAVCLHCMEPGSGYCAAPAYTLQRLEIARAELRAEWNAQPWYRRWFTPQPIGY